MRAEIISLSNEVKALLSEAQLPVSDLATRQSLHLLGVREGGELVGVVGIEVYDEVGLLRSLAVDPARRNSGLGAALVSDAETWAAGRGIKTLYLLTTTAAEFFAKRGYEATARSEAPAAIAATAQFKDLCPASSTLMRKVLAADNSLEAYGPGGPRT
jgi:amino-acid N-acetyltransferase